MNRSGILEIRQHLAGTNTKMLFSTSRAGTAASSKSNSIHKCLTQQEDRETIAAQSTSPALIVDMQPLRLH